MDIAYFSLAVVWVSAAQAVVSPASSLGHLGAMGPLGGTRGNAVGPGGPQGPPDPLLEAPEGYMAFVEAPNAEPPKVGPPPYVFVDVPCPGVAGPSGSKKTLNNLCGDLNKGVIPRNPMRPNSNGSPYPFELIKNKTLEFFSKALPILQADESLPKVAKSAESAYYSNPNSNRLVARSIREVPETMESSATTESRSSNRKGRKFCDNGGGVMCMLYKAFQGEPLGALGALGLGGGLGGGSAVRQGGPGPSPSGASGGPGGPVGGPGGPGGPQGGPERREDGGAGPWSHGPGGPGGGYEGPPPTPCPARVEYSTPVFARNYQGVWRYVVQIPYEGYFTQTVEVTRCLQNKCHYMDGACLSSPRWLSMLVAELYYPDAVLPGKDQRGSTQYLHKRSTRDASGHGLGHSLGHGLGHALTLATPSNSTGRASSSTPPNTHCDGVDEIGCFQVRLYYDWFLVPGSCKCWRPEYFSRFVRRKQSPGPGSDL